jgi:diguanylate cyclase (GGDEF)-like protein
MADLDSFKNVNDAYGHEAGDIVLQKFADLLRANTRASDICGRIGGEEFVMVITHAQKPDTQIVVDRIRRKLEPVCRSKLDRSPMRGRRHLRNRLALPSCYLGLLFH